MKRPSKNGFVSFGAEISRDYAGQELIMAAVLKGSLYFFADLTRAINIPLQLDFIAIGNYQGTMPNRGVVRFTKDLDLEITGKHLLLVEDIIRTGLTTGYLVQSLSTRQPASIRVCSLLVNPDQQLINVPIAYQGFENCPHTPDRLWHGRQRTRSQSSLHCRTFQP